MRLIMSFINFWYDFIIGDDWAVAVGVVLALAVSALFVRQGIAAWWIMPLAVVLLLIASLWRVSTKT